MRGDASVISNEPWKAQRTDPTAVHFHSWPMHSAHAKSPARRSKAGKLLSWSLSSIEPWVAWQDWSTHNEKSENERPNEGWSKWVNPLQHYCNNSKSEVQDSRTDSCQSARPTKSESKSKIHTKSKSPISSSALEIVRSNMKKKVKRVGLLSDLVSDPLDSLLSSLSFNFICQWGGQMVGCKIQFWDLRDHLTQFSGALDSLFSPKVLFIKLKRHLVLPRRFPTPQWNCLSQLGMKLNSSVL